MSRACSPDVVESAEILQERPLPQRKLKDPSHRAHRYISRKSLPISPFVIDRDGAISSCPSSSSYRRRPVRACPRYKNPHTNDDTHADPRTSPASISPRQIVKNLSVERHQCKPTLHPAPRPEIHRSSIPPIVTPLAEPRHLPRVMASPLLSAETRHSMIHQKTVDSSRPFSPREPNLSESSLINSPGRAPLSCRHRQETAPRDPNAYHRYNNSYESTSSIKSPRPKPPAFVTGSDESHFGRNYHYRPGLAVSPPAIPMESPRPSYPYDDVERCPYEDERAPFDELFDESYLGTTSKARPGFYDSTYRRPLDISPVDASCRLSPPPSLSLDSPSRTWSTESLVPMYEPNDNAPRSDPHPQRHRSPSNSERAFSDTPVDICAGYGAYSPSSPSRSYLDTPRYGDRSSGQSSWEMSLTDRIREREARSRTSSHRMGAMPIKTTRKRSKVTCQSIASISRPYLPDFCDRRIFLPLKASWNKKWMPPPLIEMPCRREEYYEIYRHYTMDGSGLSGVIQGMFSRAIGISEDSSDEEDEVDVRELYGNSRLATHSRMVVFSDKVECVFYDMSGVVSVSGNPPIIWGNANTVRPILKPPPSVFEDSSSLSIYRGFTMSSSNSW